ncbi:putative regulator of Ras-like GTPase activity (Roadblock/LC7/MglB family) [Bradyrhizobium sp. LB1.3]
MMDDEVLLPDRREDVAAVLAHALGMARDVRGEFEIGPVEAGELRELVHGQYAVDQQHLVVGGR